MQYSATEQHQRAKEAIRENQNIVNYNNDIILVAVILGSIINFFTTVLYDFLSPILGLSFMLGFSSLLFIVTIASIVAVKNRQRTSVTMFSEKTVLTGSALHNMAREVVQKNWETGLTEEQVSNWFSVFAKVFNKKTESIFQTLGFESKESKELSDLSRRYHYFFMDNKLKSELIITVTPHRLDLPFENSHKEYYEFTFDTVFLLSNPDHKDAADYLDLVHHHMKELTNLTHESAFFPLYYHWELIDEDSPLPILKLHGFDARPIL